MSATTSPPERTWNLGDLFADLGRFEVERQALASEMIPAIERFAGCATADAAALTGVLDAASTARRSLQRLLCFASLTSDHDTRDAENQARRQQVELLATELQQRTAFLRPEILAAGAGVIEGYIDAEPRLAPHAYALRDLLRQRGHVRGPEAETLLAETGPLQRVPPNLYQVLANAELPRPEVTLESGESVALTPTAFQKHRTTSVRADRRCIYPAFFSAYQRFRETLGLNLYGAVKSHVFVARARNYESSLHAALSPDNIPESVYRTLIAQVRRGKPLLHRYLALRARALGLKRLEYHDLACPLTDRRAGGVPPGRARRLVVDGLAPLGDEYAGALERAFDSRWIDWHPRPGKRAGAYATGWAYDVHPYVLLNYTDDHESVMTLAHEMGHAMHSHFSNAAQPFASANYAIFVAEVASTFNESLVLGRMLEESSDPDEQIFLLSSYLDGIRATLFRQAMFAEFELEIHERAERGDVLTGERLSEIYLGLLRDHHGHGDVMLVDDAYAIEWAAIPHFYFDFYVYQYSTGIVAAHALARLVRSGDASARDRYLAFLRSGGSDDPLELLRSAGVDLETSKPYDDAFAEVEQQLDRLETALDRS